MKIIVHPSLIIYDKSISKTREQYKLKRKKNNAVKEFRKTVGLPEKGDWFAGRGAVDCNGETYLGNFAGFDVYEDK